MSKQSDSNLIEIPLPFHIFDKEDAVVKRVKRLSVERVSRLRAGNVLFADLAEIYPEWINVVDVDTGDPLPNPKDDPTTFGRLDYADQFQWLLNEGLAYSPNRKRRG